MGRTLLGLLLGFLAGAAAAQDPLGPGQEGKLEVPGCSFPCVISVPSDYARGRKLPLIFFMHGSGGSPTSWPWRTATDGKGYIIVGLSYGPVPDGGAGGIPSDKPACLAMVEFINKVRDLVDRTYGIDRRNVFLTGLSMGGWGVNFYGFLEAARGLYRGYVIMAAGPRAGAGVDFAVAKGLPVLLLNGEKDQNLAAANSGRPELEKAGAIVQQVVIPGEGHVPSDASMKPHLKEWLERLRRADERTDAIAAVTWADVRLDGPTKKNLARNAAFEELLGRQEFVRTAPESRPILIFATSQREAGKGKPTPAAAASEAVDHGVLSFPQACGAPVALRRFACFRVDLSEIDAKTDPNLNETSAPLVFVLTKERTLAAVLKKDQLRDAALLAEMKKVLDPADVEAVAARTAELAPVLKELQDVLKKRDAVAKAIADLRGKGKDTPVKKLTAKEEELAALDAQYDALKERLRQ